MLNEERVILMTKMEAYEEKEGKRNVQIGNYFRGDYISLQTLKSVISSTIAFGLVFALYIFYHFEELLQDIYKMDLAAFARKVLIAYGAWVIAYGVISYIVYSYRYSKAKNSLKNYYANLKRLNSLYNDSENELPKG